MELTRQGSRSVGMVERTIFRTAAAAALFGSIAACSAQPRADASRDLPAASVLASSSPAPGSTVQGPVNELVLRFNLPARLDEVTLTGPDGTMPTMVHAVGEVADYSLPLPGLEPGSYNIYWKASAAGQAHSGSFGFTVK